MVDSVLLAALTPLPWFFGLWAVGLPVLTGRPLSDRTNARVVRLSANLGLFLSLIAAAAGLISPAQRPIFVWFEVGHHQISLEVVAGTLYATFGLGAALLGWIAARFSDNYLHADPGQARFLSLLCLFCGSVQIFAIAGSFEVLFLGWELAGLCSALLIAFFYERNRPVAHGLRAFLTYRSCDLGLLIGTLYLARGGYSTFQPWGRELPLPNPEVATAAGLLLLLAASGKSALLPVSPWLPRAMEGPTPSSAIFYGGVSIHMGIFLLLRSWPLFEASPIFRGAAVTLGLCTALVASLSARACPDAKGALGWAAVAQTGLMAAEIGLGLRDLALAHMIGHMGLRTYQILRASSAISDHMRLSSALGHPPHRRPLPGPLQGLAVYGFHLDAYLRFLVVRPVLALAEQVARTEEKMEEKLQGRGAPK